MHSSHPRPWLDRITQYGAVVTLAIMLLSLPLQVLLAFSGARVMLWTAVLTLLLCPFMLMLTTSTPALTLSDAGFEMKPMFWRARFVPWAEVEAVKPFPLLPHTDAEVSRRVMTGKRRYRPAEGIMLVVPSLPAQYRIVGFLAGESGKPVIAVTTRTHTDYDKVVKQIRRRAS